MARDDRSGSVGAMGVNEVIESTPTLHQLSSVISQATAPAFLLGALSGFIAILISRLNRIIDRSAYSKEDALADVKARDTRSRLKARAILINQAIMWAVASSICTAVLLIVAFFIAFFNFAHEYGVGLLFIVALGTFAFSLINFAREVRMAVMDFEHFD
jgi:uncharacterized membrane protein YgcG